MAAKKRTASPKPKTRAAIERERAAAARARFAREKKRSAAALKGWAARRSPENTYDRMVRNLEQYKKSGTKRYYRLFRTDKRLLFEAMPAHEAEMLAHNAADMAGWDLTMAIRFAKLS